MVQVPRKYRGTAHLWFVPSLAANRKYTGWPKDRVLMTAQKLLHVVTFGPEDSARPDHILYSSVVILVTVIIQKVLLHNFLIGNWKNLPVSG